jgi:hypothetical protein
VRSHDLIRWWTSPPHNLVAHVTGGGFSFPTQLIRQGQYSSALVDSPIDDATSCGTDGRCTEPVDETAPGDGNTGYASNGDSIAAAGTVGLLLPPLGLGGGGQAGRAEEQSSQKRSRMFMSMMLTGTSFMERVSDTAMPLAL